MKNAINTKNIKQNATFNASPHQVYELLMDSKMHSKFSGGSARISRKVGGSFTAYDGWIEGRNLQFIKDKKIVQKWRGDDWPEGHYSTVTFKLSRNKNGTKLEFIQVGVPANKYKDISEGWREHYWEKMAMFLESSAPARRSTSKRSM